MVGENALVVREARPDARVVEVRARLVAARAQTREALAALRQELPSRASLRDAYRTDPLPFLALAFFTGFVLAHRR